MRPRPVLVRNSELDTCWHRATAGITIIETVVVLAVLGILLTLVGLRPPGQSARLFSNDLEAFLAQGRYEAVKRHSPVAIVWDANRFVMRTIPGSDAVSTVCTTGTELAERSPDTYRRVSLSDGGLDDGLVWLPNGLVRTCAANNLATSVATAVSDGRRTFTVSVSVAGAVSVR